ncbi:MAG: acetyl-CoA carboxylase, carboxyltransferase subunit beta [Candidatus Humimicrobiaceae bacterium]
MTDFKCEICSNLINMDIFLKNFKVCPYCNHHYLLDSAARIDLITDEGTFNEEFTNIKTVDFLDFVDTKSYKERIRESEEKSGIAEAIVTGYASIGGFAAAIGVMDFSYMGGSMGSVVGEKITRLSKLSIEKRIPLIIVCSSGGARMQEGIISLMQMAKTVSAINNAKESLIPYISIVTNPTTGGVSASFATIADVIIAEPEALFCFAGPRVVKQTIKKELPPDFGLSERNLKNGQIDMIVNRKDLKNTIIKLLKIFS